TAFALLSSVHASSRLPQYEDINVTGHRDVEASHAKLKSWMNGSTVMYENRIILNGPENEICDVIIKINGNITKTSWSWRKDGLPGVFSTRVHFDEDEDQSTLLGFFTSADLATVEEISMKTCHLRETVLFREKYWRSRITM
ncbi:hypothetical protein PFISCL1PPCAC_25845, partial [Pristionchus fissidentatus]